MGFFITGSPKMPVSYQNIGDHYYSLHSRDAVVLVYADILALPWRRGTSICWYTRRIIWQKHHNDFSSRLWIQFVRQDYSVKVKSHGFEPHGILNIWNKMWKCRLKCETLACLLMHISRLKTKKWSLKNNGWKVKCRIKMVQRYEKKKLEVEMKRDIGINGKVQ
jgi:hypothetical protein